MKNFTYHNPTLIQFGENSIRKLSKHIPRNANVMFVYGGGSIRRNGVYQQVIEQLAHFNYSEFGGIEVNPEYETAMRAVHLAKQMNIDFILAVGGGSVVDASKFIAAAANYEHDPWQILCGAKVESALPVGCVLTLPATGSESNPSAVMTRSALGKKRAFISPLIQPKFAILDPSVTYSLPKRQLINGVIDPFVHVVEQYLTYPVNAVLQDRFAESIMINLIELSEHIFEHDNYQVRANLMWNATQALNGLIGAGVPQDWSTHMIGHELTALYGLDHAATLAIILPRLLVKKRAEKYEKLLQFARRVWRLDTSNQDKAIDQAIEQTEAFFNRLGMKTRLSDYKIGDYAPDEIKQALIDNGHIQLGEHKDITPEVAKEIVRASL